MIVLDTNVLSELMRATPNDAVVRWSLEQPDGALYTTAITKLEMLYGLALLPTGKRRKQLESAVNGVFAQDLGNRVLPFDSAAAPEFARICVLRRAEGRPIGQLDAQIAAIARVHRAQLATRNDADFQGLEIAVVNPFLG